MCDSAILGPILDALCFGTVSNFLWFCYVAYSEPADHIAEPLARVQWH